MDIKRTLLMVAGTVTLPCCLPVLPTSIYAADADVSRLEEVVVTAQKRKENLQDIGISVNALTGEQIRELGISNAEELANFTPNMNIRNTFNGVMPIVTIRGIGATTNDVIFATTPPSAATHVDEVYFGSPALLMFSQFDLERVEVLKGPQGTLYGRNTTAGSVNFISAAPQSEFGSGLEATYGQFQTGGAYYDFRGHVTGPLSESVNGRLSFMRRYGDSYVTDLDDVPYRGADMVALRAILDWQATDNLLVRFNLHGGVDESAPLIGQIFLTADAPGRSCRFEVHREPTQDLVNCVTSRAPLPIVMNADGSAGVPFARTRFQYDSDVHRNGNTGPLRLNDIDNIGGHVRVEWDRDRMGVVSITAYEDARVIKNELLAGADFGNPQIYFEEHDDKVKQFSQELRVGSSSAAVNWLVGAYYFTEEVIHDRIGFLNDEQQLPENFRTDMTGKLNTDNWAAFTDFAWHLTDALTLNAGLRYTYEEKTYERDINYSIQRNAAFDIDQGPSGRVNPITGVQGHRFQRNDVCRGDFCTADWDDVNWKVGVDYRIADAVLLYGVASTGFKGGQYSGSSLIFPDALSRPADPENILAFEVGVKSQFLDNSLRVNASVFDYDYADLQIISTISTPQGNTSALDNAEKMAVRGLDLDLVWAPLDGLDIALGVGYLDGEYTDFKSVDPLTQVVADFSGAGLINAPDLSATAGVRYEWPVGSFTWSVGAEAIYTGYIDYSFRDSESVDQRAYGREALTQFNARLGIATANGVNVMVWGRNLSNEEILNNIKAGIGGVETEWAPPRSFGITLNVDF